MPATLSDRTERVLADLPPYYSDDPGVQAVLEGVCSELDRVEAFLNRFRDQAFPQNADDTDGMLMFWEKLLGIPVGPAVPLVTRQAVLLASVRARFSAAGSTWVQLLTYALGTDAWTHAENFGGDYILQITTPYSSGYTHEQVFALARRITPAHLSIVPDTEAGFIVGVSAVGDAL